MKSATTFDNLKNQRDEINNIFLQKIKQDKALVKILADSMAEAATNIQGQGYPAFLNARETFLSEVDRMSGDCALWICQKNCD